jgi:hypothetical protein
MLKSTMLISIKNGDTLSVSTETVNCSKILSFRRKIQVFRKEAGCRKPPGISSREWV